MVDVKLTMADITEYQLCAVWHPKHLTHFPLLCKVDSISINIPI